MEKVVWDFGLNWFQNLSEENESLRRDQERLTNSLRDATKEMDLTTERYLQVKEALRTADDTVEVLAAENERLKTQVEGPKAERAAVFDEMVAAIDKKIEDWKVGKL